MSVFKPMKSHGKLASNAMFRTMRNQCSLRRMKMMRVNPRVAKNRDYSEIDEGRQCDLMSILTYNKIVYVVLRQLRPVEQCGD